MAEIELIVADALDLSLGTIITPQWGVYLGGIPVIQPASQLGQVLTAALSPVQAIASLIGAPNIIPVTASVIDFEYGQDLPLSTYPQEQGAFQAYDKVTLPFDVKVKLAAGGPVSTRQAFISTCLAISQSFSLFDIVTPELTFPSCNCMHMSIPRRTSRDGVTLIKVDLWFMQVPVTASASFTSTQQPGEAGQQSLGNVQPQTLDQNAQNAYNTFGAH